MTAADTDIVAGTYKHASIRQSIGAVMRRSGK